VGALKGSRDESGEGQSTEVDEEEEEEEDYEDVDAAEGEDATDVNGEKLLDGQGRGLVRVCEEEDKNDENVQNELRELEGLERYFRRRPKQSQSGTVAGPSQAASSEHAQNEPPSEHLIAGNGCGGGGGCDDDDDDLTKKPHPVSHAEPIPAKETSHSTPAIENARERRGERRNQHREHGTSTPSATISCPICSLENPRVNATCVACAHVLDPRKDPRHWSCRSEICKEGDNRYLNAGDAGVCGICGMRKAG